MLVTLFTTASANAQDVRVSAQQPKATSDQAVYIVQLIDPPVAGYTGGLPGMSATAPGQGQKLDPADPDVVRYAGYLDARHTDVASRVGANKLYDYRYAFNGFSARLTRAQVAAVKTIPGVVAVEETRDLPMDTATTPAFLGLTQATGLWSKGIKGENVVIGVVDSGIWPESKSFTDRTGIGPNGQQGKLDYYQLSGWHGKCASEEETDGSFDANLCNQKLIGAQFFCLSKGCDNVLPHEFLSPRDYNGHGTHTASTAGGNQAVPLTGDSSLFGSVNGIAPRARIAAYKVCWDDGEARCFANSGDSIAAIDQAVIDGVDVLNYSIAGTSTNYLDAVEVAFLFAARAGVFVATSAGNSGPTLGTVAHIGPWLASVAAGTHSRSGEATVTLGNNAVYTGASLTPGVGPRPIVLATASGLPGAVPNLLRQCYSDDGAGNPQLDPAKVAGKIVVCERGGPAPNNARVDKSLAVKNAGGVGVVIYNVAANSINADLHSIPTVHVDNVTGAAIVSYVNMAGAGATATLSQAIVTQTAQAPDVAAFSSRGPSLAGVGDILKPDFMAPGQDIIAAVAPPGNGGKDFDIYSGTSMSSPHVAGIGALLSQAHPEWSPAAMRSAIATTADALSRPGLNLPFNTGSGHVRPNLAENPGIVYDVDYNGYLAFLKGQGLCCAAVASIQAIDASNLNQPSLAVGDLPGAQTLRRTVTNVTSGAATYTASIAAPAGYTVSVSPPSLVIPAGGSASFDVTITRTTGPLNAYSFGALTWFDGVHTARSPIVVRPVALAVPPEVNGAGSSGVASYSIKMGYTGNLSYASRGLIPSQVFSDTVADDPTDNFDTDHPADNQGIKTHDIVVPAGTSILRVSMFDPETDGADDIDLYLYRVNPDSTLTFVGVSGSGTSAEQIQLSNPAAATYRLFVHGWQTDGPDAKYSVHAWALGTTDAGNMTASGPTTATTGGTGTVNLSWSGLAAGKYFGAILYQDGATTHATTLVRIDN